MRCLAAAECASYSQAKLSSQLRLLPAHAIVSVHMTEHLLCLSWLTQALPLYPS